MGGTVFAGIVTYNPSIERLELNINSITDQVKKIILVDNGSLNKQDIVFLCEKKNVQMILNNYNAGIAFALNQIMQSAKDQGADWCITLDQDSVCPLDLVSTAKNILRQKDIGQIVPQIIDHNTKEKPNLGTKPNGEAFQKVGKSITSAAITNVDIWDHLGGFDNDLFIDYVDFDYALRLKINGFSIIRMNNVFLDHELGNSVYKRVLFKKIRVANHSAFRKYYICRNIVIYIRRYYKKINVLAEILRLLKTVMCVIFFEKNKRKKMSACMRGIWKGLTFKLS